MKEVALLWDSLNALKLILILSNAPVFILCKSVIQLPTIAGVCIKN